MAAPGLSVDWAALEALADRLGRPGFSPGNLPQSEWQKFETALERLVAAGDWAGVLRLRHIFDPLLGRDSVTGAPVFQRLSRSAIRAAETLGDDATLARLLSAEGHNLHRQGYHTAAITAFERSARLFAGRGQDFDALQNFYMTALCHRALENRAEARAVLERVLAQVAADDAWRANPLQVLAWLAQDEGDLAGAERLLVEAIGLYRLMAGAEIQVAGALADLGEVAGLRGKTAEARRCFEESLQILGQFEGQYERQEARTRLKLAEMLARQGDTAAAMRLLDAADDKIRGYGHYYDLMWRIETLRAFIYVRRGQWGSAARKLRVALRYRRAIGLSNRVFARQLARRVVLGIGLPR